MPIKILNEGTDQQKEVCVLSYSSYSVYKQCPRRYYLEKVAKVSTEPVDITYTVPGRIVHDAAEHFFKEGSLDKFHPDALYAELYNMGQWSTVDYDAAYGSFDKALDLLTKSAKNLEMFLLTRESSKQYMSEQWFGVWNSPLYLSENLGIQGAADLLEINPNGTALLYDFKTTWNTKNISRDQLILYAIAAKLKWNIDVKQASFFMLPVNKFNYFTFTDFDKETLLKQFQAAADDILANKEKLPARYNDKCKYCPFYGECEHGKIEQKAMHMEEGTVSFDNFGVDL